MGGWKKRGRKTSRMTSPPKWGIGPPLLSSFGFFGGRRFSPFFFLRDTDQVVTGHPHTHLFGFSFSLFCPAALFVSPFLAVRPASWRFSRGAILGPARFWDFP